MNISSSLTTQIPTYRLAEGAAEPTAAGVQEEPAVVPGEAEAAGNATPAEKADRTQRSEGGSDAERNPEEEKLITELKRRDQEVRTHEAAHMAAGGQYVRGGASYTYTTGPDGRRYASGGEVSIDASAVPGDPQATIAKMQAVRRAAMAPAQPSGQDMSVAGRASQAEMQARADLVSGTGKEASSAAATTEDESAVGGTGDAETAPEAVAQADSPAGVLGPAVQAPVGGLLDAYA